MERLLTLQQVADFFGVRKPTIYNWMKNDGFPHPKRLGSRRVYWKEADIQAWIDASPEGGYWPVEGSANE